MAVSPYDLTTVQNCKIWTNATISSVDDATLQRLITSVSKQIIRQLGRNPLLNRQIETRNGNGGNQMFVRSFPIARMNSVSISSGIFGGGSYYAPSQPFIIPSSSGSTAGYIYSDNMVTLIGYKFPRGSMNVILDYLGGYTDVSFEQVTLDSPDYTVAHATTFVKDLGVVYGDGTSLQRVHGSPMKGQYSVTQGSIVMFNAQGGGNYTFSPDDVGSSIILDYQYGYIPEDLEQIAIEAVAFLSVGRKHIGQSVVNTGGQVTKFVETPLPPETLGKLANFDSRVPVV